MTNVCEERELQISMLLSGNLTADTELELRAHVDCCPACRDDLRALQEDHLRLSELPETMQPAIERVETSVLLLLESNSATSPQSTSTAGASPTKRRLVSLAFAASILALLVVSILTTRPKSLYAQIRHAVETSRNFHAVTKTMRDGVWQQAVDVWYARGTGLRVDWYQEEVLMTFIDDGTHQWKYTDGNDYATKTERRSTHMNREIMDVISLEEFKEILSGDPTGTVTIDEEEFQTYERTNAEETYRAVLYIDDRKRARRFSDFGRNDEGEWIIREMNELHYDVEMDESIFTPNFGENVSIKEPDLILKEEFALDRAVVTREEFGLVFALHELKRCKNGYVYVVCSIRPTEETIRELGPPNDNIWSGYGDLRMMNSWRRTEDAELLYYYHSHHLADARFHGLSVTWDVLTRPEDSWPLALENCVLSAYIHSRGRLEKKFTNRGEPYYRKFNPLLTVPLPTEEVSFSDVIARMHSRMLPLESAEGQVSLLLGHEPLDEPEHLRPITRLPRQISAEEFERISRERIEPSE